ncbi:hypothetical protein RHSIM_Rhsim06G0114300 [Rhododendron simsii]|uniref:V-type proton ATPase subunit G n=2 Tax=Rhododendron TaxID=4346 RepID=A0A834GYV6_RHOSS|nr:hypothetical protein RHSIM_Rhsim06G0114300 [Rhododendron simsii]
MLRMMKNLQYPSMQGKARGATKGCAGDENEGRRERRGEIDASEAKVPCPEQRAPVAPRHSADPEASLLVICWEEKRVTQLPMDSMKGQGGIQMLLTAEQEAQQIVAAARNLKLTRLKQAKDEAEKEVSNYRSHLDAEFKNKIAETTGSSGSTAKQLEEETEMKIRDLKDTASRVSPDIVGMLIKNVTAVKT